MISKKFWALASFASVFIFSSVMAVGAVPISLLQGQNHYYTVMMREDKRSLVFAKVTFQNPSDKDELKSYSFTAPDDVKLSDVTVQQILAKDVTKTCKKYETYDQYRARITYGYESDQYYYNQNKKCLEYDETSAYDDDYDYDQNMSSSTDYYYYDYYLRRSTDNKFEYKDLDVKQSGSKYTVELPNTVKPKKQGALLISYTTKDYITGSMGRFDYNFKTLLASQIIDKSVVAINFDDELYSKVTSSKREVSESNSGNMIAQGADMSAKTGYESRQMDDIQNGVGKGGRYIKEKTQLLPNETFSVKGVFATSEALLNLPVIVWTIVGLIAIAAAAFFGYRWFRRKFPRKLKTNLVENEVASEASQNTVVDNQLTPIKVCFFVSLVSYGVTALLAFALIGVFSLIDPNNFSGLMVVLVSAAFVFVLITLFIAPLVYVVRYGVRSVFRWLLLHTGMLFLVFVIIALILAAVSDSGGYAYM